MSSLPEMGDDTDEPYWILARKGIALLLNNNHAEAEGLFLNHTDNLTMFAGFSFAVFMDALMSFEEDKLTKAVCTLKELERRCSVGQNGWIKSISQRVFSTENAQSTTVDQIESQIILADSQVCIAILTFLQQDLSGYFKGGWALRKAWKVYQKTYKDVLQLYRERIGELQLPEPAPTPSSPLHQLTPRNGYSQHPKSSLPHSKSLTFSKGLVEARNDHTKRPNSLSIKKSISINESLAEQNSTRFNLDTFTFSALTKPLNRFFDGKRSSTNDTQIDNKTIVRLLGAVSFGYGLFQLGVSLLPPSLVKLVSLLGFAASRKNGIACLMYARLGVDMRAPLASLSLLWYHTIVRPFYAIDGTNVQAGVDAASEVLRESQDEFGDSALFLFFKGRVCRLNSDIPEALRCFRQSNDRANQREIKILAMHEVGWCYLIQLDYRTAKNVFLHLKSASRWSKGFYAYLAAICIGANKDYQNYSLFDELKSCIAGSKGAQLDAFLSRRLVCCPQDAESAKKLNSVYWKLLIFEMLYLWNAIASCDICSIDQIITDCGTAATPEEEPRRGMASFIKGICLSVRKQYNEAADCFRKCLDERSNEEYDADDAHISAFALFELGYMLVQNDETKEDGKRLLQQVSKYTNYDFEGRLTVRIQSTLKHL